MKTLILLIAVMMFAGTAYAVDFVDYKYAIVDGKYYMEVDKVIEILDRLECGESTREN